MTTLALAASGLITLTACAVAILAAVLTWASAHRTRHTDPLTPVLCPCCRRTHSPFPTDTYRAALDARSPR